MEVLLICSGIHWHSMNDLHANEAAKMPEGKWGWLTGFGSDVFAAYGSSVQIK